MTQTQALNLDATFTLPQDSERATLIGRLWQPGLGPTLVLLSQGRLLDASTVAATCSQLINLDEPVKALQAALAAGQLPSVARLSDVLGNSHEAGRDTTQPWLLAPCDLQTVKASGVTFVASLLERVIEEQARGDASRADVIRRELGIILGDNLRGIVPGSAEAARVKEVLISRGAWSQYLEVGIGPDAEIFTKAPVLSAVGTGADVGIHPGSAWNNPEPEIVLAINARAQVRGASLGNDVNLRDVEGRSALLLGKAKDNNASCAIGPFIRLFDAQFGIEDVRQSELTLTVRGPEGFEMHGSSSMSQISRDPLSIVSQLMGPHHQYPDGAMLFLGTMFAPSQDRLGPGQGFTHVVGDVVTVSSPALGGLVNRVQHSDQAAPWRFGLTELMLNLAKRGLLGTSA
jgi:fumarylacetoacetate (FAA) hydrolase family protein